MAHIGVFVCHCGVNIASVIDVERVAEEVRKEPGVVFSTTYQYMCSEPGQGLIKESIQKHGLDRVVVAACSPRMHEPTFRRALKEGGLNPYLLAMVNIREHASWVHQSEPELATQKAIDLVRMAISKARELQPLEPILVPVEKRALVIGGGIAGIQAALDVAQAGYEVTLLEQSPSIGGKMAQLDKTFPTLDCSA